MKKLSGLIFVLFIGTILFAEDIQKVKVSNVKIIVDDVMYIWKEGEDENSLLLNSNINNNESSILKLQTILSFSNFKPGKKYSISGIENERMQTELRLLNSGLLFYAKVSIVPPRKDPELRTIIIDVKSGFFKRFSGGNAYGSFGKAALNGNRDKLLFFVGLNKNGFLYKNENSFDLPLILGANIFWNGPECFIKNTDSILSVGQVIGIRPSANLTFAIRTKEDLILNCIKNSNFIIQPFISYNRYLNSKIFLDSEIQISSKNFSVPYVNGAISFHFNPISKICIANMLSLGISCESNFNLYQIKDCLSENMGLTNLMIRSGYSEEELCTNEYYYLGSEIRFTALNFTIPPVFPCALIPFIYGEGAVMKNTNNNYEIRDAFGIGLRILFENPVFAYFSFSYGINHELKNRFCFSASAGF